MIIACDVDGVLADLDTEWYRRYNRDYNDNLTRERVTGWNVSEFVKPECGLRVLDYLSDPDLYAQVQPIPGAVEGIHRLRAAGHEVFFVTACTFGMVDQKAQWLRRWGFSAATAADAYRLPKDLVVVYEKHRVLADLLIDDGPHNIMQWVRGTSQRRRAILLEYPYSHECDLTSAEWLWCYRAHNWDEILSNLIGGN